MTIESTCLHPQPVDLPAQPTCAPTPNRINQALDLVEQDKVIRIEDGHERIYAVRSGNAHHFVESNGVMTCTCSASMPDCEHVIAVCLLEKQKSAQWLSLFYL